MDETSFEMGFHAAPGTVSLFMHYFYTDIASSEYLNKPAPRNNCVSEIGHLLRLITIYARAEDCLGMWIAASCIA
jgi:hypothetical protein